MKLSPPELNQVPLHSKETLQTAVITYMFDHLAEWRDAPRQQEAAEEALNGQLCSYMDACAKRDECPFFFLQEQREGSGRRVDIAAKPDLSLVEAKLYTSVCDDAITVIEAKRLPAPSKDREREYVTGWEVQSGGIQRFKLGLHGAKHEVAAMIGYVQKGTCSQFKKTVNKWIEELDGMTEPSGVKWSCSETLAEYMTGLHEEKSIARLVSSHDRHRSKKLKPIQLHHLWVEINQRSKP